MKLIYSGPSSPQALDFSKILFNCTRNKNCQKQYFVPIRSLSDLVLYADLPGKPTFIEIKLIDTCNLVSTGDTGGDFSDDFSDDFFIGDPGLAYGEASLVSSLYVVAQKPDFSWYAVLGNLVYAGTDPLKCFFLQVKFTIAETDYIYFSEQICIEDCEPLTRVRACYADEAKGVEAFDCNGIYYGFHAGPEEALGMTYYRYIHWAYVRKGSVIEKSSKINLTFFNSKRPYKNVLTNEQTFEFELIPTFYKKHLMGIFALGAIFIEDDYYKLGADQSFAVLDFDSKLWAMDVTLEDECKNYFGCNPGNCQIIVPDPEEPPIQCANPPTDVGYSKVSAGQASGSWIKITHDGGSLYFLDLGSLGFFEPTTQPVAPPPFPDPVTYSDLIFRAAGPANFAVYILANYTGWVGGMNYQGVSSVITGAPTAAATITFSFTGGTFDTDDRIEYEIYNDGTNALVASGLIVEEPLSVSLASTIIDPSTTCTRVRWRKVCHNGTATDWQSKTIGNCGGEEGPIMITGRIDAMLVNQPGNDEHREKMTIVFDSPTPGPISYEAGWDFTRISGAYVNTSNGDYPPPITYPSNQNVNCGITPRFTPETIPAGIINHKSYFMCVDPGWANGRVTKLILWNVVVPAGYALNLVSARSDLIFEVR